MNDAQELAMQNTIDRLRLKVEELESSRSPSDYPAWIDVNDRMPEETNDDYTSNYSIVCLEAGVVTTGWTDCGTWFSCQHRQFGNAVAYWMPLPPRAL